MNRVLFNDTMIRKPKDRCIEKKRDVKFYVSLNDVIYELTHQFELVDNICSAAQFVNAPQNVADIHVNGPVQIFIK